MLALFSPLLLLWNRDKVTCVLLTYVLTFVLVFLFFKTRIYWYNSIIPVLVIVMAKFFTTGYNLLAIKFGKNPTEKPLFIIFIAVLFIASPMVKTWLDVTVNLISQRADYAAQEWVENNLPTGSRILTVGWYAATLPRLRARDPKSHARWAEYFMYRRNENKPWVDQYVRAHMQLLNTAQPTYRIFNIRKHYHNNYQQQVISGIPVNELFDKRLAVLARNNKAQYIITASKKYYAGSWEDEEGVELLLAFNSKSGFRGSEVKIFRIN